MWYCFLADLTRPPPLSLHHYTFSFFLSFFFSFSLELGCGLSIVFMFARFYFTRGHYPGHNVCFPSLFSGCKPLGVSRNLTVLPKEEKIIVLLPLFFFFFFFSSSYLGLGMHLSVSNIKFLLLSYQGMFDSQIKTGRKGRGNLLEVGESPFYFSFLFLSFFFFFFLVLFRGIRPQWPRSEQRAPR